jgi:monofunctional biosynthetic peptidoglycan transglycosylase
MNSRKLARHRSKPRWFLFLILPIFVLLIFGAFFFVIPNTSILRTHYPVLKYSKDKKGQTQVYVKFEKSRPSHWASLETIPSWVQGAVITSEDWAFYSHQGFDLSQIQEALEERVKRKRPLRGASTLSQQLVKNVFLDQDRSWSRKIKEALLTIDLENKFSKRQILEFYLNIVEWGPDVVGISQASRYYFSKSPSALNPREAAFLAFLLPNPIRYSESFRRRKLSRFASQQIHRNLQRMKQARYISEEQFLYFSTEPLSFEERVETQEEEIKAPTEESVEEILDEAKLNEEIEMDLLPSPE